MTSIRWISLRPNASPVTLDRARSRRPSEESRPRSWYRFLQDTTRVGVALGILCTRKLSARPGSKMNPVGIAAKRSRSALGDGATPFARAGAREDPGEPEAV